MTHIILFRCVLIASMLVGLFSHTVCTGIREASSDAPSSASNPKLSPDAIRDPDAHGATQISFSHILSDKFRHVSLSSAPPTQEELASAGNDPTTFLFSDPPKLRSAPIVDLSQPRPFRSLNALVHRYRHLHVYRSLGNGLTDSRILLMRRPPSTEILVVPSDKVVGLDERIKDIEYVKRNYGDEVAWLRFHKLFTPLPEQAEAGWKGKGWKMMMNSGLTSVSERSWEEIRQELDEKRVGKLLSKDGQSWLGIRINPQGLAEHYDVSLHVL